MTRQARAFTSKDLHLSTLRSLITALGMVFCTGSALAQESTSQVVRRQAPPGITTAFYSCLDNAGSDPGALGACINVEKGKQDARLNTSYKTLIAKLGGKQRQNLVSAERDWLAFDKSSSTVEASLYPDETIADLQVAQGEIFRLCDRANVLGRYLMLANDL